MSTVNKINGRVEWRNPNGKLHRVDGPAVIYNEGHAEWRINGVRHNLNGPATSWSNNDKSWLLNNKLHCIHGPSLDWKHEKEWCLGDETLSRQDYNRILKLGV